MSIEAFVLVLVKVIAFSLTENIKCRLCNYNSIFGVNIVRDKQAKRLNIYSILVSILYLSISNDIVSTKIYDRFMINVTTLILKLSISHF